MINKNNGNWIFLISAAVIAVLFGVLSLWLLLSFEQDDAGLTMTFEVVLADGNTCTVKTWNNTNDGIDYLFLPSDSIKIALIKSETKEIKFENIQMHDGVELPLMQDTYSFSVFKKGELQNGGVLKIMQSANLPALYINTHSGSMDFVHSVKGNEEKATYSVFGTEHKGVLKIKGRGNTSWTGSEKKGYSLTLDIPVEFLGLPSSDTYVLVANAGSNFLSNSIAFYLAEKIGMKSVVSSKFVDLYLNGNYAGNYLLCESIGVGYQNMNINDLDDENEVYIKDEMLGELGRYTSDDGKSKGYILRNAAKDFTGGYIIERDVPEYYAEDDCGFITDRGDHYVIKSPRYADISQVSYISAFVNELEDAVYSEDGYNSQTGKHYSEYIDIESFAKKYVLEEFLAFSDAGRSSAYYYKDRDSVDPKLYVGPGWDFGGAFLGDSRSITRLNSTYYSTALFENLLRHDDFKNEVYKYYDQLLKPALQELVSKEMEIMANSISASVDMDSVRWQRKDFYEDCNEIKRWIIERIVFIDEYLSKDYIEIKIVSDFGKAQYFYLEQGELFKEADIIPYQAGTLKLLGYFDENGNKFEFSIVPKENITLEAVYEGASASILDRLSGISVRILPEIVFCVMFLIIAFGYFIENKKSSKRK